MTNNVMLSHIEERKNQKQSLGIVLFYSTHDKGIVGALEIPNIHTSYLVTRAA